MNRQIFFTKDNLPLPHVDRQQMREVDRIAEEDYKLNLLQMMENAGRSLAIQALEMLPQPNRTITVLAGAGGNGGGGICAARHLYNRGCRINLLLSKPAEDYRGAAAAQLEILKNADLTPLNPAKAHEAISEADLVIDALIGYSLQGAPRGTTKKWIELINNHAAQALSLDLPSGVDASSGNTPGAFVRAQRTLTLALPKPGLVNPASGRLFLADIGIPPQVYSQLGLAFEPFFKDQFIIEIFAKAQ